MFMFLMYCCKWNMVHAGAYIAFPFCLFPFPLPCLPYCDWENEYAGKVRAVWPAHLKSSLPPAFGLTGSVFDQTTKKVMWSCDIQPFPWHVSRTDKCRFCLVVHRLMALLNHIQNTITVITSGNTQRNPTVRVRLLAMQRRRSFILNIFSLNFSGNTQKN